MEIWLWLTLAVAVLLLVAVIPVFQVRRLARSFEMDSEKRFKIENEARKTLGQIAAGLAVFAGLIYTAQQLRLAQKTEVDDRYFHGVEHLGDSNPATAQGEILFLGAVAAESKEYSQKIMDVVAGYAQDKSPIGSAPRIAAGFSSCDDVPSISSPIQAVVDTIGLRNRKFDPAKWVPDLSDVNLRWAWFQDYDFENVGLVDDYLECADLTNAHLKGADLGNAHLDRAILKNADLSGAKLAGAVLDHATLDGARMNNAVLDRTSLKGTDLSKAIGITMQQISSIIVDKDTKLPPQIAQNLATAVAASAH